MLFPPRQMLRIWRGGKVTDGKYATDRNFGIDFLVLLFINSFLDLLWDTSEICLNKGAKKRKIET